MPRAKDNRKAVGTEQCSECGTLARFFQVQKGNRTGYLYRRCECGADQKTGAALQMKWLNRMDTTGETMIPHPLLGTQTPDNPEPKPAQPRANTEGNPEPEGKRAGLIGLGILVVAGAAALLT